MRKRNFVRRHFRRVLNKSQPLDPNCNQSAKKMYITFTAKMKFTVAFSSWGIWHVTQHPNRTGEGDSLHYHAALKESQSKIEEFIFLALKICSSNICGLQYFVSSSPQRFCVITPLFSIKRLSDLSSFGNDQNQFSPHGRLVTNTFCCN